MSLTQLVDGGAGSLVSLDFTGMTSGTDVATALATDPQGWSVRRFDLLTFLAARPDMIAYGDIVQTIAEEHLATVQAPLVLVAYCNSSLVTLGVAEHLAASGGRVAAVVLINPGRPTVTTVEQNYDELRATAGLADLPDVTGLPWRERPGEALRAGVGMLTDGLRQTLARDLGDDEAEIFAEQLVARYRAWLTLLLASTDAPRPQVTVTVRHLLPATGGGLVLHQGPPPEVHVFDGKAEDLITDERLQPQLRRVCTSVPV